MGTALTRALLRAGVSTTVWNRTAERAGPLADDGAMVAPELDAAVEASDLVIVCLRDHAASREVLGALDERAFEGRTVVNLTSSTPGESGESARQAAERGISYLNGAIMVPTPMIGSPDAVILYSGDRGAFEKNHERLRLLAGEADFVGDDPGRAALHDVAMLEIFFAAMTSFLHAAAMVTAHGMTAKEFLPYARQMAALGGEVYEGLAADVDAEQYDGTEDNLAMELAALEHIVHTGDELQLDSGLARHMHDLAKRAVGAGRGGDGFSCLVDVLRPTEAASPPVRRHRQLGHDE